MGVRTRMSSLALVVSGVLLVTGCGSGGDSKDDVASVGKGGKSAAPVDKDKVQREYASCLRGQGITGVKVSDEGVGMAAGNASKDGGQPQSDPQEIEKAVQVCNKKVPGMQQLRAKRDEKSVEDSRKLAACARKNGIPNMADPTVVNGFPQMKMPDVSPEVWQKVMKVCKKYMGGVVALQGGEDGQ
ncbi:hypothetical protein [Streptomyces sp. NPDC094149]|uniref:hypothetical protein n=1 Tax=Streptomyces sp. NPDC094149 TaxID=3155079 RepID=UPI00331CB68A